jgi:hypothetical protein
MTATLYFLFNSLYQRGVIKDLSLIAVIHVLVHRISCCNLAANLSVTIKTWNHLVIIAFSCFCFKVMLFSCLPGETNQPFATSSYLSIIGYIYELLIYKPHALLILAVVL